MCEKNIVLDLDETLIHSYMDKDKIEKYYELNPQRFSMLRRRGDLKEIIIERFDEKGRLDSYKFWLLKRPHLTEFLKFLNDEFKHVIIWTAGTCDYAHHVVAYIYKKIPKKPFMILSRDDLLKVKQDGQSTPYHTKPLNKIFNKNLGIDISNTVILDNLHINFDKNKYNGITIPHFEPKPRELMSKNFKKDKCLLHLIDYFNTDYFMNAVDVRTLDKHEIFDDGYEKDHQHPSKNKRMKK